LTLTYIEAIDDQFVVAFWEFVSQGGYRIRQKSTGQNSFYRFLDPSEADFPVMLELFSRLPEGITFHGKGSITPIPTSEEIASLSAILLDDQFYDFIKGGTITLDGLPVVQATHLIPLKAHAWLDLSTRKENGERIDSKNIRKHKNDIFRLYKLLSADDQVSLPKEVGRPLQEFLSRMESSGKVDLKSLGLENDSTEEIFKRIRKIYDLPR
jgi:hypothetical protein